jgi:hypothetical protein
VGSTLPHRDVFPHAAHLRTLPFSPLASKSNGQHTQQCRPRYIYCFRKFGVAGHASRTIGSHRCTWTTFGMIWRQCLYSKLMRMLSIHANKENNYDVDICHRINGIITSNVCRIMPFTLAAVGHHCRISLHHLHNHFECVLLYAMFGPTCNGWTYHTLLRTPELCELCSVCVNSFSP